MIYYFATYVAVFCLISYSVIKKVNTVKNGLVSIFFYWELICLGSVFFLFLVPIWDRQVSGTSVSSPRLSMVMGDRLVEVGDGTKIYMDLYFVTLIN